MILAAAYSLCLSWRIHAKEVNDTRLSRRSMSFLMQVHTAANNIMFGTVQLQLTTNEQE